MRVYEVEIGGLLHTVQLSDEDAKARGLDRPTTVQDEAAPKSATPANKAASPGNK